MKGIIRILLIFSLIVCFAKADLAEGASSSPLIFEVPKKNMVEQLTIQPDEMKVGINEGVGVGATVVITIAEKYHSIFKKITKENIGKEMVLRVDDRIIFSATIKESISKGQIALSCSSVERAKKIIREMGREPDYHLKFSPSPEELEASKSYTEPFKSPWAEKAMNAMATGDYEKGEEFIKKAIESDPHEPRYHELLAAFYYRRGEKKLALKEKLTTESLFSKEHLRRFPGTYLSLARLYAGFSEYDKAIEYLNKVLSNIKDYLPAHLQLAEVYEKAGKYDLAIQEYSFLSKSSDEQARQAGLEGIRRLKVK